MDEKLKDLINEATGRLQTGKDKQDEERHRSQLELEAKARAAFKSAVERMLGADVLAAIGPVDFDQGSWLTEEMRFVKGGRQFRLVQVTGDLVNFEVGTGSTPLIQFNLNNADAKDRFLQTLGKELPG
jgi:hypothetical protein